MPGTAARAHDLRVIGNAILSTFNHDLRYGTGLEAVQRPRDERFESLLKRWAVERTVVSRGSSQD